MTSALLACPNCAQALAPRVLVLVGLFMLTPFLVASVVFAAIKLVSARASRR
jgi:hypothetical protein